MDAGVLIKDVARYLADYSSSNPDRLNHITWSLDDLESYAVLAAAQVYAARPGLFTQTVVVSGPGGLLDLPPGAKPMSALAVTGVDGLDLPTLWLTKKRQSLPAVARQFCATISRVQCAAPVTRRVAPQPGTESSISVEPPLLEGETVRVLVSKPPTLDDGVLGVPDVLRPAVFNWMVAYAMGTEVESQAFRAESVKHWGWGADVLSLSKLERAALPVPA